MDVQWIGAANGSGSHDAGTRLGPQVLKDQLSGSDLVDLAAMQVIDEDPQLCKMKALKALPSLVDFNLRLAAATKNAARLGNFPCVIGGDHSCAIGTWSGVSAYHQKPLGLLWIDAHMDAHTIETSETGNIHGMPLAALLGNGFTGLTEMLSSGPKIQSERCVLFGVRSFEKGEARLLERLNVRVYKMSEIEERGFQVCWQEASARVRGDEINPQPFGISLDLDGLDPLQIPSVGTPVMRGLCPTDILRALPPLLKNPSLVGFEIAEFNPQHDIEHMGLSFLIELLFLIQNSRWDLATKLPNHSPRERPQQNWPLFV